MRIIKNVLRKIFKRRKQLTPEQCEVIATKDFFDRMLPGTVSSIVITISAVTITKAYGR